MREETQPDVSQKLRKHRRNLDLLDQKLLTLFNRRLRISLEIGKIKKKMARRVYDAEREKEILNRLKRKNKGPLKESDLKRIFLTIMRVSRKLQVRL